MLKLVKFRDSDLDRNGKPPERPIGYLAPSVGTFTLFQEKGREFDTRRGRAAFVWSHHHAEPHDGHKHEHLVLDWHSHELEFAGTAIGGNYWAYRILDPGKDTDVEYVLLAKTRTDSGGDHGSATDPSDVDEGYRIFYVAHEEVHLWAWDARTFVGHDEAHDEGHNH